MQSDDPARPVPVRAGGGRVSAPTPAELARVNEYVRALVWRGYMPVVQKPVPPELNLPPGAICLGPEPYRVAMVRGLRT